MAGTSLLAGATDEPDPAESPDEIDNEFDFDGAGDEVDE